MQVQTLCRTSLVEAIAEDGMADGGEVKAELMGSSGLQLERDNGGRGAPAESLPPCDGRLSGGGGSRVGHAPPLVARIAPDP